MTFTKFAFITILLRTARSVDYLHQTGEENKWIMETTGDMSEFISYLQDAEGRIHEKVTRNNPWGEVVEMSDAGFVFRILVKPSFSLTGHRELMELRVRESNNKFQRHGLQTRGTAYGDKVCYEVSEREGAEGSIFANGCCSGIMKELLEIYGIPEIIRSDTSSPNIAFQFPENMPIGKKNFMISNIRGLIEEHSIAIGEHSVTVPILTFVDANPGFDINTASTSHAVTDPRAVHIIESLFTTVIVTEVLLSEGLRELISGKVSDANRNTANTGLYVEVDFPDISRCYTDRFYNMIRYKVTGILKKQADYGDNIHNLLTNFFFLDRRNTMTWHRGVILMGTLEKAKGVRETPGNNENLTLLEAIYSFTPSNNVFSEVSEKLHKVRKDYINYALKGIWGLYNSRYLRAGFRISSANRGVVPRILEFLREQEENRGELQEILMDIERIEDEFDQEEPDEDYKNRLKDLFGFGQEEPDEDYNSNLQELFGDVSDIMDCPGCAE